MEETEARKMIQFILPKLEHLNIQLGIICAEYEKHPQTAIEKGNVVALYYLSSAIEGQIATLDNWLKEEAFPKSGALLLPDSRILTFGKHDNSPHVKKFLELTFAVPLEPKTIIGVGRNSLQGVAAAIYDCIEKAGIGFEMVLYRTNGWIDTLKNWKFLDLSKVYLKLDFAHSGNSVVVRECDYYPVPFYGQHQTVSSYGFGSIFPRKQGGHHASKS